MSGKKKRGGRQAAGLSAGQDAGGSAGQEAGQPAGQGSPLDEPQSAPQPAPLPAPGDQFELSGDFRYATIYIKSAVVDSAEARSIEDLPPEPGDPPFQGLQYFSEEDAGRFFGRETLTARLVARLIQERFLAVIGASGSGKSSLVRAGVIPGLRRGQRLAEGVNPPKDSPKWAILTLTPGAHPLEALAAALSVPGEPLSAIAARRDELAQTPGVLSLAVRKHLAQGKQPHLLLFVDQFEEVFTLCRSPEERESFIASLLEATSDQVPLTVLVALRADFYADISQYDNLRRAVSEHQEFIGAMSREELVRAIDRPLALGDWKIQEGLIEVILDDIGYEPGALPLLSHALHETWLRRRGRTLTLSGYTESGGVRGAVAQTAESVFRGLSPGQQPVARMIFLRMAEFGEDSQLTRRRVPYSDLITRATDERVLEAVIGILADARLVITGTSPILGAEQPGPGGSRQVEVAHEALIREWPTLCEWLEEDREGLILHQKLAEDANDWKDHQRDPGALYRGIRLKNADEWAGVNSERLSLLEEEFLEASRKAAEQEAEGQRRLAQAGRRQRALLGLAGVLLAAVAYFVYTVLIYREPAVMDGIFNIAVAGFPEAASSGSTSLDQAIAAGLQEELGGNPNLLVWHDGPELRQQNVTIGTIGGGTTEDRLQAAAETAGRLQADMLIYGAIDPDQDSVGPNMQLEFYLAPRLDTNYEDIQGGFSLDCSNSPADAGEAEASQDALTPCARTMALIALGLSEDQLGHSLEALEAFLKAEQLTPDSEVIQFLLGRAYLFLVDREAVLEFVRAEFEGKAEQNFSEAIAINPAYPRAYIGLGSVLAKRARRMVNQTPSGDLLPPEALQRVEEAIELYEQAYGLAANTPGGGIPLDQVARLGLGNGYILKGRISHRLGDPDEALRQFDLAIATLEQTLAPLEAAGQARFLTQAYEYLGSAHSWKGRISIEGQDLDPGVQDYERALLYYRLCIDQGESTQDLIIKNEIVAKICLPEWESVNQYLESLNQDAESQKGAGE
jgi:tetratricopeptide (TPR) repeat protein